MAPVAMAAKYFAIPAYILLLLAVFFLLRRRGFDRSYFGITARNLSRGMIIALILIPATLAAEIMMRGGGLSVHKVSIHYIIDRLVWYLVFVGLLEELFYRGYVQTTLERLLGPTRGLYLASLVMGFTHIFQRLFLRGQNLEAALISGLVIIPLGCLPWGYLFQRTRNIFPVVFLHGMLDFLPRILGG
ncbi:CPBP family intramembrane metalloprotease [candidate division WOR-3 bacterium]|nr:CPBP family intramembrane metalloprotease [candidate division WOR-3 bacterium]